MAKFKEFSTTAINGGIQYKTFYPNGFGVSVVKHTFSYGGNLGLWELAVLIGNEDQHSICYDTPITNDVMGYLTEEDVDNTIEAIEKLTMHDLIPEDLSDADYWDGDESDKSAQ